MLVKWPKYENILRLHEYNYQGHSEDFKLGWHFYIHNYKKTRTQNQSQIQKCFTE